MSTVRPVRRPSSGLSVGAGFSSPTGGDSPRLREEGPRTLKRHDAYPGNGLRLTVRFRDVLPLLNCSGRARPQHDAILAGLVGLKSFEDSSVISLAEWFRLLHHAMQVAGEETIALSNRPLMIGTAGFLLSRARQCSDLAEALQLIAEGYNVMHGGIYNVVEIRDETLSYIIRDEAFPYTRPRDDLLHFTIESVLILLHASFSNIVQQDLSLSLRKVCTRRPAQRGVGASALAFWKVPVALHAAGYRLVYDAAVAALPVRTTGSADVSAAAVQNRVASMIEACEDGISASRHSGMFVAAVNEVFNEGIFDQNETARRLGISNATLRRRLQNERTDFRHLRADAMCDYAKLRLRRGMTVAAVAESLGFSDPRAFTRAFKLWTGRTPSEWRSHETVSPHA